MQLVKIFVWIIFLISWVTKFVLLEIYTIKWTNTMVKLSWIRYSVKNSKKKTGIPKISIPTVTSLN